MNSVANGKVYRHSPFKKMYCPAAAGDAGGAIGAAAYAQARLNSELEIRKEKTSSTLDFRLPTFDTAYLGPAATDEELFALIDWKTKEIADGGCTVTLINDDEELVKKTAAPNAYGRI